jgi:hypothetical protein
MSGRRCGDLGERCKRSQRLRLDLACRPRCAWTRDPCPYMPKAPVSRHRKGHACTFAKIARTHLIAADIRLSSEVANPLKRTRNSWADCDGWSVCILRRVSRGGGSKLHVPISSLQNIRLSADGATR